MTTKQKQDSPKHNMEIDKLLKGMGFPEPFWVEGRASIADLVRPPGRCGIYVLHFADGTCYVGQAVDVTRRYVQHRRNHADIVRLSFKRVRRRDLTVTEFEVIRQLEEAGIILRNIVGTSVANGESDLDLIIPPEMQEAWLAGDMEDIPLQASRLQDPDHRAKYKKKYERLLRDEDFVAKGLPVLVEYVARGIPAPLLTERSFWSCSCLPGFHNPEMRIFSRINIFWQEVFTVYKDLDKIAFSFHLASSPLGSILRLRWAFRGIKVSHHAYVPGGADQICLTTTDSQQALAMLADRRIVRAIRLLNLRLMQKGPCAYSRYHCLDLADHLVARYMIHPQPEAL